MLKKISAALIAVSMLAAPAMAASTKTQATINKPLAPAAKSVKPSVLNANAKMGRHHHPRHVRHHATHRKMSAHGLKKVSKVTIRHAAPAIKRG
jgi:hypothetical protein